MKLPRAIMMTEGIREKLSREPPLYMGVLLLHGRLWWRMAKAIWLDLVLTKGMAVVV